MTTVDEPRFSIRPPRARAKLVRTSCRIFRQIAAAVRKIHHAKQGNRRNGWSAPKFLQRCVVKLRYAPNSEDKQRWSAHGRYIGRPRQKLKGIDGKPQLDKQGNAVFAEVARSVFDATQEGLDAKALLGSWQEMGDPRLFKIILSPEFGERVNLVPLTRKLMLQIEKDLAVGPLEWVAAAHVNTDNPHVHIALRGAADGQQFRIPRQYVQFGIRRHAQALVTQQIGYRTRADALEAIHRKQAQLMSVGSEGRGI